jgi:hypothetical protein
VQAVQPAAPFDAALDTVEPVSAKEAKRQAKTDKAKAKRDASALLKAEQKKHRPSHDEFQLDVDANDPATTGNAINLAAACSCLLLRADVCCSVLMFVAACFCLLLSAFACCCLLLLAAACSCLLDLLPSVFHNLTMFRPKCC